MDVTGCLANKTATKNFNNSLSGFVTLLIQTDKSAGK